MAIVSPRRGVVVTLMRAHAAFSASRSGGPGVAIVSRSIDHTLEQQDRGPRNVVEDFSSKCSVKVAIMIAVDSYMCLATCEYAFVFCICARRPLCVSPIIIETSSPSPRLMWCSDPTSRPTWP